MAPANINKKKPEYLRLILTFRQTTFLNEGEVSGRFLSKWARNRAFLKKYRGAPCEQASGVGRLRLSDWFRNWRRDDVQIDRFGSGRLIVLAVAQRDDEELGIVCKVDKLFGVEGRPDDGGFYFVDGHERDRP